MQTRDKQRPPGRVKAVALALWEVWKGRRIFATDADFWSAFMGVGNIARRPVTVPTVMQLSAASACVRLISETLSTLPVRLLRKGANGMAAPAPDHNLYMLLHSRPNARMTAAVFWQAFIASLLLRGNAYVEKKLSAGVITSLEFLHPDAITRKRGDSGQMEWEYIDPENGTRRTIPASRMWHTPAFSLDGITGLSPISYGANIFGTALATEEASADTFRNGMKAPGVLSLPGFGKLNAEQRALMTAEVMRKSDAGEPLILEDGAEWHTLSLSPQDAQLLASRAWGVEEICRFFGVPPFMVGHAEKSTTWGCLPGDSLVFTSTGPKPIEEIKTGEKVWSLEEGRGMVLADVTKWQMTGVRPVLTIKTRGRELRATGNHTVPVRRYRGYAHGRKKGQCGFENVWIHADEIEVGDYLMIPHGLTPGADEVSPDGRQLTIRAMELCGMYSGDGNMDLGRVEIAHEAEPDHMEYYCESIRQEFGVEPYVDTERKTRTRFSSKPAVELLRHFAGTSLTKRVPGWVFTLKPALQLAFLRGYLDSDGTITAAGQVVYSSACRMLLEDVRHMCIGLGIPVGIVAVAAEAGPTEIRGRTYERSTKYHLNLACLSFNSRIGSNSEHKRARFCDTQTTRALRYDDDWVGVSGPGRPGPAQGWEYRDLRLHCVTSITTGDVPMPVYDITVTGTASFVADGVLVHNTGIEQQQIGFVAFVLRRWSVRIEQSIWKDLLTPIEQINYSAEFALEGLLRGDSASRATFYQSMLNNGIYTTDEVRRLENLPPMGGNADKLRVQGAMILLDSLTDEPADVAEVAKSTLKHWLGEPE